MKRPSWTILFGHTAPWFPFCVDWAVETKPRCPNPTGTGWKDGILAQWCPGCCSVKVSFHAGVAKYQQSTWSYRQPTDNLVSVTYLLELSLLFDVFLLTLNTKYRNEMASYQLDDCLKTCQTHGRTNATSGKMSPPAGFQTSRPPRIAKIWAGWNVSDWLDAEVNLPSGGCLHIMVAILPQTHWLQETLLTLPLWIRTKKHVLWIVDPVTNGCIVFCWFCINDTQQTWHSPYM